MITHDDGWVIMAPAKNEKVDYQPLANAVAGVYYSLYCFFKIRLPHPSILSICIRNCHESSYQLVQPSALKKFPLNLDLAYLRITE